MGMRMEQKAASKDARFGAHFNHHGIDLATHYPQNLLSTYHVNVQMCCILYHINLQTQSYLSILVSYMLQVVDASSCRLGFRSH